MRILVVDDDDVFREELAELLRDDGHAATVVPSVAKAIEALEAGEFDLVLTDLKMPRQSGLDLLREVRARWPRTFVVMLTGYASVETALDAMKLGAFDYVRKPFRVDQVRETLRLVAQEREFEPDPATRRDPDREARALAAGGEHEVLYFADPTPAPAAHLHPAPLRPEYPIGLVERTESFLAEFSNGAVVVAGVERLLADHRLEDIVQILERLRLLLHGHGPLRISFNPRRVTPGAAAALGGAVATDETHAALEALANPLRRKVLQRLAESPASFGESMHAAGLEDSPKMSFHLRRLLDAGLIRHEGEMYRLTPRGEAAVRLLVTATFLPPASEDENLAFPKAAGRHTPS